MYKNLVNLVANSQDFDGGVDTNAKNLADRALTYWGTTTFIPSASTDSANTDGNGKFYNGSVVNGPDGQLYMCLSDVAAAAVWVLLLEVSGVNVQTGTTYTLLSTDAHDIVTLNNGSGITLTIPTNAVTPFALGTKIGLVQLGAGQVTVAGAGVTIRSTGGKLKITGQYSKAVLEKVATDTWVLSGDIAT